MWDCICQPFKQFKQSHPKLRNTIHGKHGNDVNPLDNQIVISLHFMKQSESNIFSLDMVENKQEFLNVFTESRKDLHTKSITSNECKQILLIEFLLMYVANLFFTETLIRFFLSSSFYNFSNRIGYNHLAASLFNNRLVGQVISTIKLFQQKATKTINV